MVLVTDEDEAVLRAGDCAAFKAERSTGKSKFLHRDGSPYRK